MAVTHLNYAYFGLTANCEVQSIDQKADFEFNQTAAGESVHGNLAALKKIKQRRASHGMRPDRIEGARGLWPSLPNDL